MTTMSEWYARVNGAWPATVPTLTDWEAVRAASRLWRWARRTSCPYEIRATSGNRRTYVRRGILWVNPSQGWREFIHDLSHTVDLERGHSKHHAQLEYRMIREVLRRGYLDGRLKDKPTEVKPAPDARLVKLQRIESAMKRWDAKKRRAENALKKLARRATYYQRAARGSLEAQRNDGVSHQ
jgi:hypothetical protein